MVFSIARRISIRASFACTNARANDVLGDSRDGDPLDPRNSVLGSRDLEVHITKMVLVTKDVGEQCPLVFGFTNQPD